MILPKAEKLKIKEAAGPLETACHEPVASRGVALQNGKGGYPMLHFRAKIDGTWKNILRSAHIVFYALANGPTPKGMVLDHLCRNRKCCNPDHLEPVTIAENNRRGVRTKLKQADVDEMRSLAGSMTHKQIADRFGISQSHATNVINGMYWADGLSPAWQVVKQRRQAACQGVV